MGYKNSLLQTKSYNQIFLQMMIIDLQTQMAVLSSITTLKTRIKDSHIHKMQMALSVILLNQ